MSDRVIMTVAKATVEDVDRCVEALVAEGYEESQARAICRAKARVCLTAKVIKVHKGERRFEAVISSDRPDLQNEVIPAEVIAATMPAYMRRGVLIDSHTNIVVGKPLEWHQASLDDGHTATIVLYEVYADYPTDDEFWDRIVRGAETADEYGIRAFSVGGVGKTEGRGDRRDNTYYEEFTEFGLIEVSGVDAPAQPDAQLITLKALAGRTNAGRYTLLAKAVGDAEAAELVATHGDDAYVLLGEMCAQERAAVLSRSNEPNNETEEMSMPEKTEAPVEAPEVEPEATEDPHGELLAALLSEVRALGEKMDAALAARAEEEDEPEDEEPPTPDPAEEEKDEDEEDEDEEEDKKSAKGARTARTRGPEAADEPVIKSGDALDALIQ